MTRQQFIDEVYTYGELLDFCYDEGCEICDDIWTADSRDEEIDEYYLEDWARNNNWQDVLDILDGIPTGYDYYRKDDYNDWVGLGDYEFEEYKDAVLEWADDHESWEPEEDDEEEETSEFIVEPADDEDDEEELFDSIEEDSIICAAFECQSVFVASVQKREDAETVQKAAEAKAEAETEAQINGWLSTL